jgi:UDP-N-acetylglucosamine 2-epimerase (non-hydrolysing)
MRVVCVAGARPNYMKIKPVLDALESRGVEVILVHTGQHYDEAMNGVFFRDLGLRAPDRFLGAGSGTQAEQTARVMVAFEPVLDDLAPDVVVVVGDVNSTVACGLVAAKQGCLLAHVEAGLRSRDWTMPEEVNRVVVDRMSDYLFAPSEDAVDNLRGEGYRDDQVHLVGNVMIDTLLANRDRALAGGTLERLGLKSGEYGLVTLHRPANVDDPESLDDLVSALTKIAAEVPLVLPAHPRSEAGLRRSVKTDRIRILPPAGYLDFIALQAGARIVLTDSGGVQEETTALGVPCVTLRANTERPITVTQGTNTLAGRDPARIAEVAQRVLADPPPPRCPELWDGHAGERVAAVLVAGGTATTRLRPTAARGSAARAPVTPAE